MIFYILQSKKFNFMFSLSLFKIPIDLDILLHILSMCGFQDKFSLKFIPKKLKLGTNSMIFSLIFNVGLDIFFEVGGIA